MIEAGYDSADSINGSLLPILFILFNLVCAAFAGLIILICGRFEWVKRTATKLIQRIFWNFYIVTLVETMLESSISSAIRLYVINKDTWWEGASSVYAISQLGLCALLALVIPTFLYYKRNEVTTDAFIRRYGALTDMMSTKRAAARYYYTFFLLRRLIFVGIIVMLPRYPWAQAQLICLLCVIQMIYNGLARPFEEAWRNKLEMANEALVLTSTYFLFIYSDAFI